MKEIKKFLGIGKKKREKKILYACLIIFAGVLLAAGLVYVIFKYVLPALDKQIELEEQKLEEKKELEEEERIFEKE